MPAVAGRFAHQIKQRGAQTEFALRVNAQKSDDFYRENCTYTLENTAATAEEFELMARIFFRGLLQEANV